MSFGLCLNTREVFAMFGGSKVLGLAFQRYLKLSGGRVQLVLRSCEMGDFQKRSPGDPSRIPGRCLKYLCDNRHSIILQESEFSNYNKS